MSGDQTNFTLLTYKLSVVLSSGAGLIAWPPDIYCMILKAFSLAELSETVCLMMSKTITFLDLEIITYIPAPRSPLENNKVAKYFQT